MKRGTVGLQLLVVIFLVMYQSNPDFQAWVDYQLVRAGGWIAYGGQWVGWRFKRRLRDLGRQRREEYGPDLSPES